MLMLVRDSGFMWRFLTFEPRAWVLFEVAEYMLNHTVYGATNDMKPFISHVMELTKEGAHSVIFRYRYTCMNGSDILLIVGWLKIFMLVYRLVPDLGMRQEILD